MDVYKTPKDAAILASKKLGDKFWISRLDDMLSFSCRRKATDGSAPISDHRVKIERVSSKWPVSGSIYVVRDDGARFRLYMTQKHGFLVKEV